MLDVSLRDGGHRTNFHFTDSELCEILTPLDNSGIEYIEIGYRNGALNPIDKLGRAGICDKEYLLQCKTLIKTAKIAVMAHPQNITERDIIELKECGVELLRICVIKGNLEKALPIIGLAKKMELAVSVNFVHLSYYTHAELEEAVEIVSEYQPTMIYFADSNGSLLPAAVNEICKKYTYRNSLLVGFHAHDNLGLAQANALAAMEAGVHFIDASLAGMGKGVGNLKIEFFTAYLQAINSKKYNLEKIVKAANYVRNNLKIGTEMLEMDEFIRGISDFSTADLKAFKQRHLTIKGKELC